VNDVRKTLAKLSGVERILSVVGREET